MYHKPNDPTEFQSHAGSIEGQNASYLLNSFSLFQSHAGSIEGEVTMETLRRLVLVSIPRWFD